MATEDDMWGVEVRDGTKKRKGSASTDIQSTKRSVSMSALLQHYGSDIRVDTHGNDWVSIRCPFHGLDEKPSASIHHQKQRFRCHQCEVAGDVIDVAMQVEHLEFKEAVKWLNNNF